MQEYLEKFVDCIKNDSKVLDMKTEMLVIDAFAQKISVYDFFSKLDIHLLSEPTGIMLCDFKQEEMNEIIANVEDCNGIYETQISPSGEIEDNTIYAVFQSPSDAYRCLDACNTV